MTNPKTLSAGQNGGINVPYVNAYGIITKTLEKIKTASTPDRFTQDFLSTKLALKGGSARPIIPFLKRTGFLNADGTPTDLYKEFRNEQLRPHAAAQGIRKGYAALYEINEYVHDASDAELKGVIVQATGLDASSSSVKSIIGSFKALRSLANFDDINEKDVLESEPTPDFEQKFSPIKEVDKKSIDIKLGYTINLNLPATSDIAVFNAIFKSLRDHLIDR
ncbi:MAG: hypothetical protein JWM56_557 [Candidatus Peribacteria bacterium]|nr:hypothetical protein [Candidatus Peribacteria bacterium]